MPENTNALDSKASNPKRIAIVEKFNLNCDLIATNRLESCLKAIGRSPVVAMQMVISHRWLMASNHYTVLSTVRELC